MIRRWIIRGLAVALLMMCVVAWGGSYFRWVQVGFVNDGHYWAGNVHYGEMFFDDEMMFNAGPGWYWIHELREADVVMAKALHSAVKSDFLGFAYRSGSPFASIGIVIVPLWFVTLMAGVVVWVVWRKTRPKFSGKGFPVEVGGREGEDRR
jgi:hypothetical protein